MISHWWFPFPPIPATSYWWNPPELRSVLRGEHGQVAVPIHGHALVEPIPAHNCYSRPVGFKGSDMDISMCYVGSSVIAILLGFKMIGISRFGQIGMVAWFQLMSCAALGRCPPQVLIELLRSRPRRPTLSLALTVKWWLCDDWLVMLGGFWLRMLKEVEDNLVVKD